MNERIRLLAEQADIHFSKSGTLDAGPNGIAKFVLYADLEKFAELIVAECISVMKSTVDESIDFDRKPPETSSWIESDIKEHFGVEE